MKISNDDIISILVQFNPWWKNEKINDLPHWHRAAYAEFYKWIAEPPVHSRAIMLAGARQVGKTTLCLQAISKLLNSNIPAGNILYATFDHPLLKLAGIDAILEAWRSRMPQQSGPEFLFLDEAQFIKDWGTWIKHQVDFQKQRRIIFTGSAIPLTEAGQESGFGRWHTIRLSTLSFYESIQLSKTALPPLPDIKNLSEIANWPDRTFQEIKESAAPYLPHFHHYLAKGGFPQNATEPTIHYAQKLLREDIIDKAIKRDMTAIFGVRNILELEQAFIYLCMHDGSLLDMQTLCSNLAVKRPTVQRYLDLLEASHLIYRLAPYGYGKEILRAKYKIYLADAAISPAVMMKGTSMLDDPAVLGTATETCVVKHLMTSLYKQNIRFSYWKGKKNHEVDLVAEANGKMIPFEVKYRSSHTAMSDIKGLIELCTQYTPNNAYLVTRSIDDIGIIPHQTTNIKTNIIKIPAPLLCYWIGQIELNTHSIDFE